MRTSRMFGAALVEWFGNEARRVYQTFGESDEDRDRRALTALVEMGIGAWYVNETGGRPVSVFRLEKR